MSSLPNAAAVSGGVALDEETQRRLRYFAFDTAEVSAEAKKVAQGGRLVAESGWEVARFGIRMDLDAAAYPGVFA